MAVRISKINSLSSLKRNQCWGTRGATKYCNESDEVGIEERSWKQLVRVDRREAQKRNWKWNQRKIWRKAKRRDVGMASRSWESEEWELESLAAIKIIVMEGHGILGLNSNHQLNSPYVSSWYWKKDLWIDSNY